MTLNDEHGAGEPVPTHVRHPSTIGGLGYLLILGAMTTGLVLVAVSGDWRMGVRVVAATLAAAAVMRLLLPQKDAGMLAVRSRWVDVLLLAAVSVALFLLAGSIPDQPV